MTRIPHASKYRPSHAHHQQRPPVQATRVITPDQRAVDESFNVWNAISLTLGIGAGIAVLLQHHWLGLAAAWCSGAALIQARQRPPAAPRRN